RRGLPEFARVQRFRRARSAAARNRDSPAPGGSPGQGRDARRAAAPCLGIRTSAADANGRYRDCAAETKDRARPAPSAIPPHGASRRIYVDPQSVEAVPMKQVRALTLALLV